MMKNILLTGANGFIGRYFVAHYSHSYLLNTFSFRSDSFDTLDLFSVETIIHLSALVHQMGGATEEAYKETNIKQTLKLAHKAKKSGVAQFIFMSTVKVYGEESDMIYSESSPCMPQDDYGRSKLEAEKELQKLENDHFKISIIRTPIVYGYGVKGNIQNLIALINKVPILPLGDIDNKRSMVYIGNLCHLIASIIQEEESGIFLASDDDTISTTNFIELITKNLNKKTYLIHIPFFENLLALLRPLVHKRLYGNLEVDNTQTKKKLDLKNPYSTDEGIKLMLDGKF